MAEYQSTLTGAQMDASLLDMAQHNSEAWAIGERNGVPVSSTDPTYQKNAKYWAQHTSETAHPPYIGANGNWYVWSSEQIAYVDSGVYAKGETGEEAEVTATEYAQSNQGVTPPTTWQATIPVIAGGEYLWTRFTWNNNTFSYIATRYGIDGTGAGDMLKSIYSPNYTGELASKVDLSAKQDSITSNTDITAKTINAGLVYTTTAPTGANANGLKIAVLSSEPATKYSGWLYIITE